MRVYEFSLGMQCRAFWEGLALICPLPCVVKREKKMWLDHGPCQFGRLGPCQNGATLQACQECQEGLNCWWRKLQRKLNRTPPNPTQSWGTLVFYNVVPHALWYTGEFRRLGRCFADLATAVAVEADIELTCVTFTYRGNGPIYKTSAQSMELSGGCHK